MNRVLVRRAAFLAAGALVALSLGWNGDATDATAQVSDPAAQTLRHLVTAPAPPAMRRQATVGTSELVGARANDGALLFLCAACVAGLWARRRRVIVCSVSPARPALLRRRYSIALRGPPVAPAF